MSDNDRTGTSSNHRLVIGSDLIITHTIKDDAGTAVDLTNATLRALVKADRDADADAAAVATFTCAVVSAGAGTVKLTLPDTEVAKLTANRTYDYDLRVRLPVNHAILPGYDDYPLWGKLSTQYPATRAAS